MSGISGYGLRSMVFFECQDDQAEIHVSVVRRRQMCIRDSSRVKAISADVAVGIAALSPDLPGILIGHD